MPLIIICYNFFVILKLSGVLSEVLFVFLVVFCWMREKTFNFRKNTFSYFGSRPKTKKLFNSGLFFIILIRIIFVTKIFIDLTLWKDSLLVLFGIIAFFGGLMAAVFSIDKNHRIHGFSARLSAVFSVFFILFVGLSIVKNDLNLGIFNLLVSIFLTILTFYLLKVKKVSSVFETIFLILIIIWDNVMTLKLFNII